MEGKRLAHVSAVAFSVWAVPAFAQMRITEYMYNGLGAGNIGEFVEFTNVGTTSIDMTGWSFDDNSRVPGSQSLTAFGIVVPGQSVILTDNTAAAFRTAWGLSASVAVIGGNANNLGRADEINLYDNTNALVDRLTYDDQTLGGPRTNGTSAWVCSEYLGANNSSQLRISVSGDVQGSHLSTVAELGNPGSHTLILCLCGNGIVEASVGEQCDGGACCTATCQFVVSGTQCRASTGVCDPAESCNGTSGSCPANIVSPSGTECRASAGDCDPAETCDGTNGTCPADLLDPAGTECRASTGQCDPAELCTGNSPSCPPDSLISLCANGDGCCPAGCDANTDDDCDAVCGNGITEPGEACDGASVANCPSGVCNPNCTCHAVAVPTVSEWGLAILALVGLCAGTIMFGRGRAIRA